MFAEIMAYIDVDLQSWKWGEIRKTSPISTLGDVLEFMEKKPGNYGVIAVPSAGSPRYDGLHGGINAADVIYSAGIVSPDTMIIAILNDSPHWPGEARALMGAGAFLIAADGFQPAAGEAKPILPDGALVVHQGRPPIVELRSGTFSEAGLSRLATSMEAKLTRAFVHTVDSGARDFFREVLRQDGGLEVLSCGHVHGWWNAYDFVDGYGAWTLAKAVISYAPEDGFGPIDEETELMEDIGRLWNSVLADDPDGVKLFKFRNGATVDSLEDLQEQLGIKPMVEARIAGVPVEDIVA